MNKGKKLLYVFHRSKGIVAFFSLLLSFVLIVGSSYAWYTAKDEKLNRMEKTDRTKKFSAILVEDFVPVDDWAPGTTRKKVVKVKNDGELPAIVRLSFHEYFLHFEVDVTDNHAGNASGINGNGNLRVYGQPTTAVEVDKLNTWEKGNTYSESASIYYKAAEKYKFNTYKYDDNTALLSGAFYLNFTPNKIFYEATKDEATSNDHYWFYEDHFFYYSEILQPGEETTDLLKSVSLSNDYPNEYKGALYKLVPRMDAHEVSNELFTTWNQNLKPGYYAYKMYEQLIP